jgi:hypothetical protein
MVQEVVGAESRSGQMSSQRRKVGGVVWCVWCGARRDETRRGGGDALSLSLFTPGAGIDLGTLQFSV